MVDGSAREVERTTLNGGYCLSGSTNCQIGDAIAVEVAFRHTSAAPHRAALLKTIGFAVRGLHTRVGAIEISLTRPIRGRTILCKRYRLANQRKHNEAKNGNR